MEIENILNMVKRLNIKHDLAELPTPLEKINRFSEDCGIEFWIKRDDLTEFFGSGNKIRKLEFLFQEALEKGTKEVVTCGGIQSNHCRATAYVARRLGIKPVLFLRGKEPESVEGNLFLDKLLDAEIHWITSAQYDERDRIMADYKARREEPDKTYVIPEGGSNYTGSLGYFNAVLEMAEQTDLSQFDAIYLAMGSGGTFAGILAGLEYLQAGTKVFAVNVTPTPADEFAKKIVSLLEEYRKRGIIEKEYNTQQLAITDDYVGEGYAIPTKEGIEYTIRLLREDGLLLDPVYTSKAFSGMVEESKKRGFRKVLFLHTGGGFGNFAYKNHFDPYVANAYDDRK